MSDALQDSYDEIPYPSGFFPETHPDRMAAMATLFGLAPAHPGRCRVLELGCANGGNLLPMAQMLPDSEFVGIDLSPRQIDDGRRAVAALGLGNVTLRPLSILDVDASFGRFDYIVCHGVYSWVPEPVREKILEICATHLNPEGVAYVSYNTYPGWHFRGIARDLMNFHAATFDDPATRVRQARAILDFVVRTAPDPDSVYTRALKGEVDRLDGADDSYVYHEHLESLNRPVYFHEFMAQAGAHGLGYVGPARFDTPDANLAPEIAHVLDGLTDDRLRREQYLDFVRNRQFRQSLLCRADRPRRDTPSAEALERLRFVALARPESPVSDVRSEQPEVFLTPSNDRFSIGRPRVKVALGALARRWPGSATLDELWAEVRDALAPVGDGDRQSLADSLLDCRRSNLVALHVIDPPIAPGPGIRPEASPVARHQSASGSPVFNQRLRHVQLDDFDGLVLPLLDGTRDRAALVDALADRAAQGAFTIEHDGRAIADPRALRGALAPWLEESLARLAGHAFLIA